MEISVIIPLYNKALYIRRAIDSGMKQTYSASEIIVIDDGSTDNGYEIAAGLAQEYPNIRLFRQNNQGVSLTRNTGVSYANCEHVAFLDADDEWKPDYLSHINRLYHNFPDCGAYATAFEVIRPDGSRQFSKVTGIPPAPWIGIIPNLIRHMQSGSLFYTSSIVINKAVFKQLKGFPVGIKRGEDLILWVRLGIRYPIAYSPSQEVIYHTEAENRACEIFTSLEISALAVELADMLENDLIPADLVQDVREYYHLVNIRKAKQRLDHGDARAARTLLRKAKTTQRYKLDYLWWLFWSGQFPCRLLPLARKIKHKLN